MTYFLWNQTTKCYLSRGLIGWKSIQYFDAGHESDRGWDYESAKRAHHLYGSMKTVIVVNNRELLRKFVDLVMKS